MASQTKIYNSLKLIHTVFPNFAANKDTLAAWEMLLDEYSDEQLEEALKKTLKSSKFPPSPAEIIENMSVGKKKAAAFSGDYEPKTPRLREKYFFDMELLERSVRGEE